MHKSLLTGSPASMHSKAHLVTRRFEEIKESIQPPQSNRYDFYEHISLPPNYVERPGVLEVVRMALLGNAPTIALTSAMQSSKLNALHGMGGIGKSVIARVLCDDLEIQAAFPDGILWVTLGQKPELVPVIRSWINALGGIISENAPTVESLKNILAKLLKDRACLLIVDDVWRSASVEPFLVGGPRCRLLFTTRKAEIADKVDAKVLPIPIMTESEAITLLEIWAKGYLSRTDSAIKVQVVKRLGYLPLAVKLAGAQLQRIPADEWLRYFTARKLKYQEVEKPHDSVELTFGLSLDELDEHVRQLYIALAIFKEDEATPQVGIERLWNSLKGLDASTATNLLNELSDRALLEVIPRYFSSKRSVLLHDLFRDLISIELGNERVTAHRALLAAYRVMNRGVGWHIVPDDGYLYDHLAYHLQAADSINELKMLFVDQHWLYCRVQQRDYIYDGYLEDLTLAWEQTNVEFGRQIEIGNDSTSFADSVRYLFIRTSINSIVGNYVPELVIMALEI